MALVALPAALVRAGQVRLVRDLSPGLPSSNPERLKAAGARLVYTATAPGVGTELWGSDGTHDGTVAIDIRPGSGGSFPDGLRALGGSVFFAANDGTTGYEPWLSDGTPAGTRLIANLSPTSGSSGPFGFSPFGARMAFAAFGTSVWLTDGSEAGTSGLVSIPGYSVCPRPPACFDFGSMTGQFVEIDNTLFFTAAEGVSGGLPAIALWTSDGTPGGTGRVTQIGTYNPFTEQPHVPMAASGGVLFFRGADGELWRSDGTAEGTVRVADVNPGTPSAGVDDLTDVEGKLFFTASGPDGREVWTSDGTEAGTVQLSSLGRAGNDADPGLLTAAGDTLFFAATTAASGRELWKTDGTPGGTVQVADIRPGPASGNPEFPAGIDGLLYFCASDGSTGTEAWASNGTAAGTVRLGDITPGPAGSGPTYFTGVGGLVLFAASEPSTGRELWLYDPEAPGGPCGDGRLDPGEQCDEGGLNGTASSCCGAACALVEAGTACRESTGPCEPAEACTGADPECPPEQIPPDSDGDGICDAADPCTLGVQLTDLVVTIGHLNEVPGDDTLRVSGRLTVPTTPPISPATTGLRLVIQDFIGTVLDVTIPGGTYNRLSGEGWRARGARALFLSRDGIEGITRIAVDGDPGSGFLRVSVRGRRGAWPVSGVPLGVTLVIDAPAAATGQCGEAVFPTEACSMEGPRLLCR